jgi:hypothetical protein
MADGTDWPVFLLLPRAAAFNFNTRRNTMRAFITAAALLAASFGVAEAGCQSWQINCNGRAINGGTVDGYGNTWNRNLGGGWSNQKGDSWSQNYHGDWRRSDGFGVTQTLGGGYRDTKGNVYEQNIHGEWRDQKGRGCRQLLSGSYACD